MGPWSVTAGGLRLRVRLTPRGGRDGLGAVAEIDGRPVLTARVAAPPVDGAANAALTALVAKALGVPLSAVSIEAGASGRIKTLIVAGDGEALARRLSALVAPQG